MKVFKLNNIIFTDVYAIDIEEISNTNILNCGWVLDIDDFNSYPCTCCAFMDLCANHSRLSAIPLGVLNKDVVKI